MEKQQSWGTCKGCGQQILWTKTKAGKAMPCNPVAVYFTPAGGPETFVTPDGRVERGFQSQGGQLGYISHFATCPNADRFRRRER